MRFSSWKGSCPACRCEYRLYLHPVVLGHGKPFFAGLGRRSAL